MCRLHFCRGTSYANTRSAAATFVASGVAAGTYDVRVRAKNNCGPSAPSNETVLVVR